MAAKLGVGLTVKQPWAHLIVAGVKDIENRGWRPGRVQRVLVHAGARSAFAIDDWVEAHRLAADGDYDLPPGHELTFGAIIGEVTILGVVDDDIGSVWMQPGAVHWRLADPVAWPDPLPCRGLPGFFDVFADGTTAPGRG